MKGIVLRLLWTIAAILVVVAFTIATIGCMWLPFWIITGKNMVVVVIEESIRIDEFIEKHLKR